MQGKTNVKRKDKFYCGSGYLLDSGEGAFLNESIIGSGGVLCLPFAFYLSVHLSDKLLKACSV